MPDMTPSRKQRLRTLEHRIRKAGGIESFLETALMLKQLREELHSPEDWTLICWQRFGHSPEHIDDLIDLADEILRAFRDSPRMEEGGAS